MNASTYGLTASIWTNDTDAALTIGDQIETGTWYMNRCDYLDPALAWTGVKDTGWVHPVGARLRAFTRRSGGSSEPIRGGALSGRTCPPPRSRHPRRRQHLVGVLGPAHLEDDLDPGLPDVEVDALADVLDLDQVGAPFGDEREQRRQCAGPIVDAGEHDRADRARLVPADEAGSTPRSTLPPERITHVTRARTG